MQQVHSIQQVIGFDSHYIEDFQQFHLAGIFSHTKICHDGGNRAG